MPYINVDIDLDEIYDDLNQRIPILRKLQR
jgi:hypothetical protein